MAEKVAVQRKVVKRVRARLTRERVVAAAITLADADDIEGLSMRRLAQELGVEVMSLYYWFRSKSEVLEAMLAAVYVEFERPDGDDWRKAIRHSAISAHRTLLRHPWACTLVGKPMVPGRARLEWMDAILGCLRAAGFSAEQTHHAYHALDSHIVGFTMWVLPYLEIMQAEPEVAEQLAQEIFGSGLPHLVEHLEYHIASDNSTDTSEFEYGLDLLLDSLERARVATAT